MSDRMLARKDGAIGWLIFEHPERRNAVTQAMWLQVGEILSEFAADPEIRVVVLRGAGERDFVSGGDISQFDQTMANAAGAATVVKVTGAARKALAEFPKPTIAMIQGYCLGGGLGIAMMCDLRFAAEGSVFGIPAARLGIAYPPGGLAQLQSLIGPAFTRELLFTARNFDHREALQMGLVNRVMPHTSLETFVREQATLIAANAPLTLRATKVTSIELLKPEAERNTTEIARTFDAAFDSSDYQEGRKAFREKRPPVFTGH